MKNSVSITRLFFIPIIALIFQLTSCQQNVEKQERPNIIFIMSDDHAYQAISAYDFGINECCSRY